MAAIGISVDEKNLPLFTQLEFALSLEEHKEAFLLAACHGHANGTPKALSKKKQWIKDSSLDEADKCLLAALFLADKDDDFDSLDWREVYQSAEEWANAGILLFKDDLAEPTAFAAQFSADVMEKAQRIGTGSA